MKRKQFLLIPLSFLIVAILGLICAVVALRAQVDRITLEHQAVYDRYLALEHQMQQNTITIYESDQLVGVYSLADVGLEDQALAAMHTVYTPMDRMEPQAFSRLSYRQMVDWFRSTRPGQAVVTLNAQGFQPERIWYDLMSCHREPSVDAQVVFTGNQYLIEPEVQGNELEINAVMEALLALPQAITFSEQHHSSLCLDVSPYYVLPQVTREHGAFDLEALLRADFADLTITVDFDGSLYQVDPLELLTVDPDGFVVVKEDAVDSLVEELADRYSEYGHPYYFDSYIQGRIPISWLKVDHTVRRQALKEDLAQALAGLENASVTAHYTTERNGREFSLGSTYIAIDIANQHMVFYKNGRLILATDVVTGDPAQGGTPKGLWSIQEFDRDCWLVGSTYREHVDYWIGVHGNYGIHDAVWRDSFGGSIYLYDGSHGCVNTPSAAMALLYETANLGTPVLFY